MPDEPTEPMTSIEPVVSLRTSRWRLLLPAGAFLSGFLWDVFTVGRQINSRDLVVLVGYFAAAAVILVVMGSKTEFRGSSKLNLALQFLFGGMFSPLVVLYFMSSGGIWSRLVVFGLAAMLVINEFLTDRYNRLSLSWAVFGVCGVMILNFVLPHVMHSLHTAWFYTSLVGASSLVLGLRKLSHDEDAVVWPTLLAAALLAAVHVFNLIPPVPLVSRAMVIASDVRKENDQFVVGGRRIPGRWFTANTIVHEPESPVYCFTSIFVPTGIDTVVTHAWMRFDSRSDEWVVSDRISFRIVGGRRGGYRGFTVKQHVAAGEWKVVAESESGDVISSTRFNVMDAEDQSGQQFEQRY